MPEPQPTATSDTLTCSLLKCQGFVAESFALIYFKLTHFRGHLMVVEGGFLTFAPENRDRSKLEARSLPAPRKGQEKR